MFSPTQHEDKKFLLELGELIEILIKTGTPESIDLAEKFGDQYLQLQNKIKTYDYTKDDEKYYNALKI
jgi:hypothetical protein